MSMQNQILSEIPSALKQLAKLVVRGFYDIEYSLIVDMLVRYHCMREDDLCDLLKFDKKVLRGKLATLKSDKFLVVKLKIETGEDGKAAKMNCWFINYRIFVNIVKYKLDHMRKKMETEERDATSRSSFKCSACDKQFTDLEADQLFDPMTQEFKCTFCGASVEEDEAAMPKKDSRLLLAKFNDQMEKLYDLLRMVEDYKWVTNLLMRSTHGYSQLCEFIFRLSPDLLEPDPVDFMSNEAGEKKMVTEGGTGPGGEKGSWSGEATRAGGGFRMESQQVKISFGEEESQGREAKELPSWMTESTVGGEAVAAAPGAGSLGPSMGLVTEAEADTEAAPDDEITNLLLRHERTNKDKGLGPLIPGEDSDSDNRSDDSEAEMPGDDEAALLAATFANTERGEEEEAVEVMEDDSDENDDIPTISVGGEEYDITDVTPDVIAKMTSDEMDKYNQLYQDFYKDMY